MVAKYVPLCGFCFMGSTLLSFTGTGADSPSKDDVLIIQSLPSPVKPKYLVQIFRSAKHPKVSSHSPLLVCILLAPGLYGTKGTKDR